MANIVFLAPGLNKNRGGERTIFEYARYLAHGNHHVSVVLPKGTAHLTDEKIEILEYETTLSSFYSRQIGYIDAIFSALKIIPKNTEILIGTYAPQLILADLYKIFHNEVKFCILNMDFSAMFANRPERKIMFKLYPKFADKIISCSQFCADEVEHNSGHSSIVVSSAIEETFFEPLTEKDENAEKYIFWLGSKNKHKGYKEFWNAMQIVWEKYPDLKIYTTEGTLSTNKNTKILNINGNMDFLKKIYRNARMFVCSSHSEGFGLPALEAMSQRCPVVTTNTGGSNEYAKDGYNSIVVPAKNYKKLAEGILKLMEDENLCRQFIDNGFETAQNFHWGNACKLFEQEILK